MKTSSQLVLNFLLNASWQIALLATAVAIATRLLRKAAIRYQHCLWVAALLLSFTLPLLTTAYLSRDLILPLRQVPAVETTPVVLPLAISLFPVEEVGNHSTIPEVRSGLQLDVRAAAILLSLYLLFVSYRCLRFCRAWQRTRRIRRAAQAFEPSDELQRIIESVQTVLQLNNARVLSSTSVSVPVTIGVWRPLVILPDDLTKSADAELLTSAIGHELVHVQRRDYLFNLIYEFLYLPLAFHPGAAIVRRRINQTRELCCDEQVADQLLRADVYARSLVRLAGTTPAVRKLLPTTTVGIGDADILEVRIMSLLNRSEAKGRGRKLLLIAVALILAVPCVAAAAFNLQLDVTDMGQSRSVAANQRAAGQATLAERMSDGQTAQRLDEDASQQDRRTQEEREAKERAIKERAERDPEFRARLEQSEREAAELKERAERELKQRLEVQAREVKEAMQSATTDEDRDRLKAKLKALIDQHQVIQGPFLDYRSGGVAAAKWARISMEQAIQIATNQTPGKVLQCSLVGESEDRVFYHVVILSGDEENPVTTRVMVNAINGVIVTSNRARPEISGGVLNGKAVRLPNPEYPEIAKAAKVSGSVSVEVTIAEAGNVIAARAVSGHPLLQAASVAAARNAQFSPTKLNGEAVKVTGVVIYNFVAQ